VVPRRFYDMYKYSLTSLMHLKHLRSDWGEMESEEYWQNKKISNRFSGKMIGRGIC